MFGHKLLRSFGENFKKTLKVKAANPMNCNSKYSHCKLVSQNLNTFVRQNSNGFPKPIIYSRHNEFEGSKRNSSTVPKNVCWDCKKDLGLNKLICQSCGALQKPREDINYYELLGIDQSYDINIEDMSLKFRNLQMSLHPDKFTYKLQSDKETSEFYSRLLNKAFTTLKNPVSRGFYLLKIQNSEPGSNNQIDPEFLISIMEKNEELEKINSALDLQDFIKASSAEIENYIKKLSEAFQANKLSEAKVLVMKLNYYANMDTKAKKKFMEMKQSP